MIDSSGLNQSTNCVVHFPPKIKWKRKKKRSYTEQNKAKSNNWMSNQAPFYAVFLRVHVSLYIYEDYNIIILIQAASGLASLARLFALTDLRSCVFVFNVWLGQLKIFVVYQIWQTGGSQHMRFCSTNFCLKWSWVVCIEFHLDWNFFPTAIPRFCSISYTWYDHYLASL